ncbi:MAG: CRISPR-associated protein Csx11 [Thermodesulforhabdaceae bacterium]
MNQLDILQQHREALLLAEAIGLLHDYRKCSDEHLKTQASNLSGQQALARNELGNRYPQLSNTNVQLLGITCAVTDLLDDRTWNKDVLGQYLSRCHKTAHFDKQEPVGGKQNYPHIQRSTPFGFENNVFNGLTEKLWGLPWDKLSSYSADKRNSLRHAIEDLFSQTIADTRRPINEVDLWSWGLLVGALYKSALAGALLTGSPPNAGDLRWRLLGVRVNGLNYLLSVARIPDLLTRQEIISDSLDRVRNLLEVTYPLGSEVYRDENGSVYVVPDIADLLNRTDGNGISLRDLILQEFEQGTVKNKPTLQLGGEITPHLGLEQVPWWGQDPEWPNSSNDELPDISKFLSRKIASLANAGVIQQFWQHQEAADICTVCGLRPQGPSQKAADRNVCDICEERRADRSQKWATSQSNKTIWTDEVADANGRLALIVGRFDLTHWLDGSLLDSLLLIAPHNPENAEGKPVTSKTPSFSRLRRIWETTRRFWRDVQNGIEWQLTDDRRRLKIFLDSVPDLGPFHVYDLVLGVTNLSVVWIPARNDDAAGYLLSADNLGYIAHQLGAEPAIYGDPATAAIFVEEYLQKEFVANGCRPVLRNPDAGTRQSNRNLLACVHIVQVEYQQDAYATLIPILAEPQTFMIIVSADKSLDVLRNIKEKYEREMGKVRDRLPIHLGVVYASRRTPIRAVLDAGRAMLDCRTMAQRWTIESSVNGQSSEVTLDIKRNGHQIRWRIPLRMNDGMTEDQWYPYIFLDTRGDDKKVDDAQRRAVKIDWPAEACWIVHAGDLREGEVIYVWPSTFDFEFLDTTARRFEIHYDEEGRRPRRTRPYYLEDLDRLEGLWNCMKRLTKTQRHQVIRTIEATREMWYGQDAGGASTKDDVFRQFVADTLAGAQWEWQKFPTEWQEKLIQAGVRGELTDLAELHMEILKE